MLDTVKAGQGAAAWRKRTAPRIKKPGPQRCGESGASVVGGAAAQAHDDAGEATLQGFFHYLAGPGGGGDAGIAASLRDEGQARCQCHLDNRRSAVAHDAPARLQGLSQRPGHGAGEHLPPGCVHQGVQGAVASVGDRGQHSFRAGCGCRHSPRDGLRRFQP